jgi:hypothetical protein
MLTVADATPDCVTVTFTEQTPVAETVISALRDEVEGLGVAEKVTLWLPLPEAGVTISQSTDSWPVTVHAMFAVMAKVFSPPALQRQLNVFNFFSVQF